MKIQKMYILFIIFFISSSAALQLINNKELSEIFGVFSITLLMIIILKNKKDLKTKDKITKLNKEDLMYLTIFIILSLLTVRSLILEKGLISLIYDWSIPPFKSQLIQKFTNDLSIWKEQGLGINIGYYSGMPVNFLLNTLGFIGINGELISKGFLILFLFLSASSSYLLSKNIFNNKKTAFLAALLYTFNPLTFSRIIAGYIFYLLSYAITPLIIIYYKKTLNKKSIKALLICGLLYGISISQIQFILITPIILLCFTKKNKKQIKKLTIIIIIGLLMHLNWILPIINNFNQAIEIDQKQGNSVIKFLTTPIPHSLVLVGSSFSFLTQSVRENGMIIPWMMAALSISLIVLYTLTKKVPQGIKKLGIISLIIMLFMQNPIEIPFIRTLLRDSHYLLIIPALLFSLLIPRSTLNNKKTYLIGLFLLFIYSYPFFTGNYGGYLSVNNFSNELNKIFEILNNDSSDTRVLWLPMIRPISYLNKSQGNNDPTLLLSPKPAITPILNQMKQNEKIIAYLNYNLYNNIPVNNLLKKMNIKYVIIRNNFETNFTYYSNKIKYSTESLHKQFENENKIINNNITVYQIAEQPHIYSSKKIKISSGRINELENKNDVIFLTQNNLEILNYINKGSIDDYDLIPSNYSINLLNYIDGNNPEINWVNSIDQVWENEIMVNDLKNGIYTKSNKTIKLYGEEFYIKFYGTILINNKKYHSNNISYIKVQDKDITITPIGEVYLSDIKITPSDYIINKKDMVEDYLENNCEINYTKISKTKYIINNNCDQEFFLIFSETFDKNWIATQEKRLPHFVVNGYANAYYVNKTGDIVINYKTQQIYELGIIISFTTTTIILSYLFINPLYSFLQKKKKITNHKIE